MHIHEDVEGWPLGAQLHHSLPYYLVSESLTEPGARDLVLLIILRLQVCTAIIHGFVYMSVENSPPFPLPPPKRFYLCSPGCCGLAL